MNKIIISVLAACYVSTVAPFSPAPWIVGHVDTRRIHRPPSIVSVPFAQIGSDDISAPCWNPQLRRIMGGIGMAGTLETAYLTIIKWTDTQPAFCGVTATGGDCSSLLNSPYAWIPGTEVPISALGFLAYGTVTILALAPLWKSEDVGNNDDEINRLALAAITTTMGVFSVFLITILFGVLKESCPYCIASAIFSVTLAKLSWLGGTVPRNRMKDGVTWSLGGGLTSFLAALFIFFNIDATSSTAYAGETATSAVMEKQAPPPITSRSSARAIALAEEMQKLDTRFFGAFWCSHCFEQKQTMGMEAMAKIPYIECSRDGVDSQSELCRERRVPGYPTWEISGKLFPGERNIDELEEIIKNVANQ